MLRAVLIGVGRHRFGDIRELTSAARDARALRAALLDANPDADITLRVDAEATCERVRASVARALDEAASGDDVLIAFAGHGTRGRRIVLHDSDREAFDETTIALDELAILWRRSAAARVILVLDCCFAGGASARVWTPEDTSEPDPPRLDDLPGGGRLIVAAATSGEAAYEDPSTRFGLLTQALLAACTDPSQSQTAMAVLGRVQDEVTSRAATLMKLQTPVVIGEADGDFRLPAMVKGAAFEATFGTGAPATITVTDDVAALRTLGLPGDVVDAWCARFDRLNELQLRAINEYGLLSGVSLVVSAPTSSGKTFLGELAAAETMLRGDKVVYLAPYRAIVTEKGDEFDALYEDRLGFRVRRASGDWRDEIGDIRRGRFDLALFTYETFLSLVLHQPDVLDTVGLVVIDEAHFIADPTRGIVVELILTALKRARARGVAPQLVALSAVVAEAEGFVEWLECRLLYTTRRPVPLVEGVLTSDGVFRYRDEEGHEGHEQLLEPIVHAGKPRSKDFLLPLVRTLVGEREEKVIVFRASRGQAASSALYMAKEAEIPRTTGLAEDAPTTALSSRSADLKMALDGGTAFHSSDLNREERRFVERAFKDRDSGLGVLTSTTTLAAGVNLPASTVVISETAFPTQQPFTVAEYKNMAGRAGRLGQNERGRSVLLANGRREADRLFEIYVRGEPEPVTSSFRNRDLGAWVLKLLAQARYLPRVEVIELVLATFGGFLSRRADPDWALEMERALPSLIDMMESRDLVVLENDDIAITPLGEACGAASFDIRSALALVDLLRADDGLMSDPLSLAGGIQGLPALDDVYTPQMRHGEPVHLDRLDDDMTGLALLLRQIPGEQRVVTRRAKRARILCAWLRGEAIGEIERAFTANGYVAVRAGDIARVVDTTRFHLVSALAIAAVATPEREGLADGAEVLLRRIDFGLPSEALALVIAVPALSREAAMRLLRTGVHDPADLTVEALAPLIGLEKARQAAANP